MTDPTRRRTFVRTLAAGLSALAAKQASADVALAGDTYVDPRKVLLWESTRKEFREAIEGGSLKAVIVPTGSTEQHNEHLAMIKGGGGALTREKIVAAAARKFVCIADESKLVPVLGKFPLPVEVIPMARAYVARQMVKLGGQPELRANFTTDNGNVVLDVRGLTILNPAELEATINNIAGVVTNGLFARRGADVLLLGAKTGVRTIARK